MILDLDNTLWGGIVGDLGYKKVDLGYEGNGIEFLKFQEFILSLKKRCILWNGLRNNIIVLSL